MSNKKKKVNVSQLGQTFLFSVLNEEDEIVFECIEPFRNWGINRCGEWIRRYNSNKEIVHAEENIEQRPNERNDT